MDIYWYIQVLSSYHIFLYSAKIIPNHRSISNENTSGQFCSAFSCSNSHGRRKRELSYRCVTSRADVQGRQASYSLQQCCICASTLWGFTVHEFGNSEQISVECSADPIWFSPTLPLHIHVVRESCQLSQQVHLVVEQTSKGGKHRISTTTLHLCINTLRVHSSWIWQLRTNWCGMQCRPYMYLIFPTLPLHIHVVRESCQLSQQVHLFRTCLPKNSCAVQKVSLSMHLNSQGNAERTISTQWLLLPQSRWRRNWMETASPV